jgi:hypothetical protein
MTLETEPAWAVELGKKLSQAYTQEELARLTEWADSIARLNQGQDWPAGTFERLLNLTRLEEQARGP